jgi:alpha-aminoadipate/glutamate carrier protein LysW
MATCPECDAELEIDDDDLEEMEVGDPWDCEACGSRLRVAALNPLEFDSDDEESDDEDEEGEKGEDADEDLEDDADDEKDDGDWEE